MESVEPGVPSLSGLMLVDKAPPTGPEGMLPSSPASGGAQEMMVTGGPVGSPAQSGDLQLDQGDASRLSKKDALPLVLQW